MLYNDGERRYIIAPKNLKVNDQVLSGEKASVNVGNTLVLNDIPVGTILHCVELKPGKERNSEVQVPTYSLLLKKVSTQP